MIQLSKQNYYKEKINQSTNNPKLLWKTLNEIVNYKSVKSHNSINVKNNLGKIETDKSKISNIFNQYFSTVGINLRQKIPPLPDNFKSSHTSNVKRYDKSMFLNPISIQKVKHYIQNLDSSKASKSDCPTIKLIKQSSDIISP